MLRAASGRDVPLVDGDDQESTTLWSATRNEVLGERNRITVIQLTGRETRDELQRLTAKYDDIIIDVGGRDTTTPRPTLTVANVLLLPFPPRLVAASGGGKAQAGGAGLGAILFR